MHLILKCVIEYEISSLNNIRFLSCSLNDVVICDSELIIEGQIFGFGLNLSSNQYGLFPVSKFIIINSTNNVNSNMTKEFKNYQANWSLVPGGNTPGSFHRMAKKSIGLATLCSVCGEYIIGLRLEFNHCIVCHQVFHGLCWSNHISQKKCHSFVKIKNQRVISSFKNIEIDISEWSNEQILQWLCSVNLFKLLDLFELKNIDGQALFEMIPDKEDAIMYDNNNTLHFWSLISDKFYRQSLYMALLDLLGRSNVATKQLRINSKCDITVGHNSDSGSCNESYIIESGGHYFREVTYLTKTFCYYCSSVLLGIHKQGFHCVKCRLDFHKTCAAQINITLCGGIDEGQTGIDHLDSSVFGVPLKDQVNQDTNVPRFLHCCIKRLESHRSVSSQGSRLLDLYSQSTNTDDLRELKSKFSHPQYSRNGDLIGLEDISDSMVANLVKLFFKELPEPLLTYGLYHSLVNGIKLQNNEQSNCFHLYSVLRLLPPANKATILMLLDHFNFVCQDVIGEPDKVKDIAVKWSCVFSKTLIWPPHIMSLDIINLRMKNQKIIQLLFEYKLTSIGEFIWPIVESEYVEGSSDNRALSQSRSSSQPFGVCSEPTDVNVDIHAQDWYWSDTTKEEINDFMAGLPDGSFLVRDSSNKSFGEYTLTVRKDGENKLIRIIFNNGFYGFQESDRFRSVAELISHFQNHKLSEYNEQLNLTLQFPVSKTKSEVFGKSNDCIELTDGDLIDLLHNTMKEYMELNCRVELNSSQNESCQKELEEVTKTIKGVDLVSSWCKTHTEHIMNTMHSNPNLREHSLKSLQILNKKLNSCDEAIKASNEMRDTLTAKSASLINSLSVDRPNLKKLNRRQQQCIRQLKERGVPNDMFDADNMKLDELCQQIKNSLNHSNPINDQSTWYIENITRQEATVLLNGKRHGTFLVRKSREKNSYALDIVVNNTVQHCLIHCCGGMYGFVKNECLYASLGDLVRTFHLRSLDHYNTELRTKLEYPVNYMPMTNL